MKFAPPPAVVTDPEEAPEEGDPLSWSRWSPSSVLVRDEDRAPAAAAQPLDRTFRIM